MVPNHELESFEFCECRECLQYDVDLEDWLSRQDFESAEIDPA